MESYLTQLMDYKTINEVFKTLSLEINNKSDLLEVVEIFKPEINKELSECDIVNSFNNFNTNISVINYPIYLFEKEEDELAITIDTHKCVNFITMDTLKYFILIKNSEKRYLLTKNISSYIVSDFLLSVRITMNSGCVIVIKAKDVFDLSDLLYEIENNDAIEY